MFGGDELKTEIIVRLIYAGTHCYPDAKLPFLRKKHYHEFGITVFLQEDKPRSIEWIEFQRKLDDEIRGTFNNILVGNRKGLDFETLSCEEIGVEVAKIVGRSYQGTLSVVVEELDEMCGAKLTFTSEELKKLANEPTFKCSTQSYVA